MNGAGVVFLGIAFVVGCYLLGLGIENIGAGLKALAAALKDVQLTKRNRL